jgi:hypothetical protein
VPQQIKVKKLGAPVGIERLPLPIAIERARTRHGSGVLIRVHPALLLNDAPVRLRIIIKRITKKTPIGTEIGTKEAKVKTTQGGKSGKAGAAVLRAVPAEARAEAEAGARGEGEAESK